MEFITIHPADTVKVSLENGHKYALRPIAAGEQVIKYGFPIGFATELIAEGAHVHTHNLKTGLGGVQAYTYRPESCNQKSREAVSFSAYVRSNGDVGIRNDIWIVNTVGCVNQTAQQLSRLTGAFAFPHPYGCSQLGEDLEITQKILCGLIRHPNAGGVLVLGLGCENNNIAAMMEQLGNFDKKRIRFLNVQDCENELEEGTRIIRLLARQAAGDQRQQVPVSKLKIGLKCGGSDGLSGITANPLVGLITDRLTAMGASAVLTEVPEMFGAEQLLMNRCVSRDVFDQTTALINRYKAYFIAHGQPVSENPSPGNKEGGITTLEEKSLGCVQKGGTAPVTGVLDYGDFMTLPGLHLLNGPGNDIVALTNLTAVGCHMVLFTTGRGTPLGGPVPTIKIATNSALAAKKPHWVDFDAGSPQTMAEKADALLQYILSVGEGSQTCNEQNAFREIAIFKDGVTL